MTNPTVAELEARLAAAAAPPIDPLAHVQALNDLAWALRGLDTARAHVLARQARGMAMEHGDKLGQARAARCMAMTIRDQDDLHDVFDLAEEAKRLFDEVGDLAGQAGSRDFLASIHEYIGDLATAMPLALEALSFARASGDPIREGYALSNVGGILAASADFDAAIEHLELALSLFERAENPGGVGTILNRLAEAHRDAGHPERAAECAARVMALGREIDSEFLMSGGHQVLGDLAAARGDDDEAEREFRASLQALSSVPASHLMGAEIRIQLAGLLIARGALAEAEENLQEVLQKVTGQAVSVVSEAAAQEAMADLRERQGDAAGALAHLRRALALREQIAQRNARNKVAQVEARAAMEAAKKDAEIHRLRYVELYQMQSSLLEAEKMALLGRLAAGTAHELNSPLGVLVSNTDLVSTAARRLVDLAPAESPDARRLARVVESCRQTSEQALARIGTVAQSFKRFAQLDQAEQRVFDLREGLESALALLRPTLPEGVVLQAELHDVRTLEGWPRELNHAFLTVLQNAVQAIDGAGTVTAVTEQEGDTVVVRVQDTGRGMSQEEAAHLFDIGWSEGGGRTKMRLGLSAAHTTTRRHGGTIEVASTLGAGTTITFRFPPRNRKPAG
ncbi:MAG: tetratricopeptide repeat protein [Myxococcales bacterium]|nr:tetratricopeptide repeat protein [Myxococcales bacterium]